MPSDEMVRAVIQSKDQMTKLIARTNAILIDRAIDHITEGNTEHGLNLLRELRDLLRGE